MSVSGVAWEDDRWSVYCDRCGQVAAGVRSRSEAIAAANAHDEGHDAQLGFDLGDDAA